MTQTKHIYFSEEKNIYIRPFEDIYWLFEKHSVSMLAISTSLSLFSPTWPVSKFGVVAHLPNVGHNRLRRTEEDDPEKDNFPPIYLNYDRYKLPVLYGLLVFNPLHGFSNLGDDHKPAVSLLGRRSPGSFSIIYLPQVCFKSCNIIHGDLLGFWGGHSKSNVAIHAGHW